MPAKAVIKINKVSEIASIRIAGDQDLTDIRDEIIEDINQYVPVQGGDSRNGGGGSLQSSAGIHSDRTANKGKLTIRWDTPYAQYQNKGEVMKGRPGPTRTYGPEKLKYTSTAAKAEWEKYAEQKHGEDWALAVEKGIKQRLE